MSRFSEMEAFVALIECGSVSAAAKQLGVAVSAISRRIKLLEDRLDTQLFVRKGHGLTATGKGWSYYEDCQQIMASVAAADAAIIGDNAATNGVFRIAAPLEYGTRVLAPIINSFVENRPDLVIDLDLSDRLVDVFTEGFDFAIRIGSPVDARLATQPLADLDCVLAASPKFWQERGKPTDPQQVSQLPALAYRGRSLPDKWSYTEPNGATGQVRIRPRLMSTNCEFLETAAINGLGVLLEPEFICADSIASGALETALTDIVWERMTVHAVYPKTRQFSKGTQRFYEHVVQSVIASHAM